MKKYDKLVVKKNMIYKCKWKDLLRLLEKVRKQGKPNWISCMWISITFYSDWFYTPKSLAHSFRTTTVEMSVSLSKHNLHHIAW